MSNECRCGRPTRDSAYVCDKCTAEFVKALAEVGWVDHELEVTVTRQKAAATTGGPASATTPVPFHEAAAEVRDTMKAILVSWVKFCHEDRVKGAPADLPRDTAPALAAWLLACVNGLALNDIGPEAVDEVTDIIAQAQRIVFWKRRNRLYLGPCAYGEGLADQLSTCPGDVYAEEGEPVGYCEECERGVTVVIRQGELDKEIHSRLLSAADIADWSMRMGLNAKRDDVRKRVLYWHRHERVLAAGHEQQGENRVPLFRYADVRLLLLAEYDTARESA